MATAKFTVSLATIATVPVFGPQTAYDGFWIESATAGAIFKIKEGNSEGMAIPIGAGLTGCNDNVDGMSLENFLAIPGGTVVIQVSLGRSGTQLTP